VTDDGTIFGIHDFASFGITAVIIQRRNAVLSEWRRDQL